LFHKVTKNALRKMEEEEEEEAQEEKHPPFKSLVKV
jgi:hypothetical protein